MPLTWPMHSIPGELLTTTENEEDAGYNATWRVPEKHDGSVLDYGDLLLVVATRPNRSKNRRSYIVGFSAWLLHCRSQRVLYFHDIVDVGWLWRLDLHGLALELSSELRARSRVR